MVKTDLHDASYKGDAAEVERHRRQVLRGVGQRVDRVAHGRGGALVLLEAPVGARDGL